MFRFVLRLGPQRKDCLLQSTFEPLWMFYVKKLLFLSRKPFLLPRVHISTCVLRGFHVVGVSSDGNLIWNTCPVFEASPAANSDRGKKLATLKQTSIDYRGLPAWRLIFYFAFLRKGNVKQFGLDWFILANQCPPLLFANGTGPQVFAEKSLQRSGNSWIVKKVLELSLWTEQ